MNDIVKLMAYQIKAGQFQPRRNAQSERVSLSKASNLRRDETILRLRLGEPCLKVND